MKKQNRAKSVSSPDYHPATGQVLSEVEGGSHHLPEKPRKPAKAKRRASVTIAPGLHSTRDVLIKRTNK